MLMLEDCGTTRRTSPAARCVAAGAGVSVAGPSCRTALVMTACAAARDVARLAALVVARAAASFGCGATGDAGAAGASAAGVPGTGESACGLADCCSFTNRDWTPAP